MIKPHTPPPSASVGFFRELKSSTKQLRRSSEFSPSLATLKLIALLIVVCLLLVVVVAVVIEESVASTIHAQFYSTP